MNSHSATVRTKKLTVMVAVSVLLILNSVVFPAYAFYSQQLPFPDPKSFGESSRSFVLYNETDSRYEYIVFILTPSAGISSDSVSIKLLKSNPPNGYSDYDFFGKAVFSLSLAFPNGSELPEFNSTVDVVVYRYWWYAKNNFYHIVVGTTLTSRGSASSTITFDNSLTYTVPDSEGKAFAYSNFAFYNGGSVVPNNRYLGWETTSNVITYLFSGIDSSILSTLNSIYDINGSGFNQLSRQNEEIIFYLREIVESLQSGETYVTQDSTQNEVVNDYNNAEADAIGDSFDNLDKAADALPDLNSFNSGNQRNAFAFISSNIEFFSGMNSNGSISKVATVMFVILGLGLASFIIGLTNRRKG